jgi:RNA polymerase sigma-70 factor (ECF subfamily)
MNPGTEDRIETLISRYYVPLFRFVCGRLPGETEIAEDITQDIFLTLAEFAADSRKNGIFRGESSVYTWLCAIAKRRIVDHYRKTLRRVRFSLDERSISEVELSPDDTLCLSLKTPEDEALEKELCERVRSCLELLPPEQRYALILKYIEDFSVKEISRVFGKSMKATESLIFRSKKAFESLYSGGRP